MSLLPNSTLDNLSRVWLSGRLREQWALTQTPLTKELRIKRRAHILQAKGFPRQSWHHQAHGLPRLWWASHSTESYSEEAVGEGPPSRGQTNLSTIQTRCPRHQVPATKHHFIGLCAMHLALNAEPWPKVAHLQRWKPRAGRQEPVSRFHTWFCHLRAHGINVLLFLGFSFLPDKMKKLC